MLGLLSTNWPLARGLFVDVEVSLNGTIRYVLMLLKVQMYDFLLEGLQ